MSDALGPVEWRPLPLAPNILVNQYGAVRCANGKAPSAGDPHPGNKRGMIRFKAGQHGTMQIAKAIALGFPDLIPLPAGRSWDDNGEPLEVHHIDSNPVNNRADNLEILPVGEHRKKDAGLRAAACAQRGLLGDLQLEARETFCALADRVVAGTASRAEVLAAVEALEERKKAILGD